MDHLTRLSVYADRPDVYDPPTPAECAAAAAELKLLRELKERTFKATDRLLAITEATK